MPSLAGTGNSNVRNFYLSPWPDRRADPGQQNRSGIGPCAAGRRPRPAAAAPV